MNILLIFCESFYNLCLNYHVLGNSTHQSRWAAGHITNSARVQIQHLGKHDSMHNVMISETIHIARDTQLIGSLLWSMILNYMESRLGQKGEGSL